MSSQETLRRLVYSETGKYTSAFKKTVISYEREQKIFGRRQGGKTCQEKHGCCEEPQAEVDVGPRKSRPRVNPQAPPSADHHMRHSQNTYRQRKPRCCRRKLTGVENVEKPAPPSPDSEPPKMKELAREHF